MEREGGGGGHLASSSGGCTEMGFSRKRCSPASRHRSSMSHGGLAAPWANGGTPMRGGARKYNSPQLKWAWLLC